MVKNEKEWQEVRLGDIIDIKMGQSPKSEFYNLNNNGLPFLQGNKTFGHLYPSFEVYTSEYKVISEPNSILMSVRAPVGDLNISNQNICIGRGLCSINGKNIELNKYIFYLLKYYKKEIVNIQTGTVFGAISKNDILNFKVKILKDEKEQKKIASILSSLDDKIELNNRMNKILEEMAQTIFKEWFVNFNFPNEDGKPYKDSGGKMIESELGAIPDSWEITNLEEICNIYSGYSYSSKDLSSSSDAMVTIKNFERNGGFKLDGFKEIIISDKVKENHYANLYDVIVAHTDITQKADIIGNPILLLSKGKYNNLIISMDLVKVTLKNNDISNTVLYNILSNINFKNHCLSYSSGTTVLHLSKKALPSYKLAYPNSKLLKKLSNILEPIYKK